LVGARGARCLAGNLSEPEFVELMNYQNSSYSINSINSSSDNFGRFPEGRAVRSYYTGIRRLAGIHFHH